MLAGKDCTMVLARGDFDEKNMNSYVPKAKLTQEEQEGMEQWFDFMKKKYPVVGRIVELEKEQN